MATCRVQWEVGSVATPFEHRSFGEELALCQRYYSNVSDGSSFNDGFGFCDGSTNDGSSDYNFQLQ